MADAFYCSATMTNEVQLVYPKTQYISQLKSNQIVYHKGFKVPLSKYFNRIKSYEYEVSICGEDPIKVTIIPARIKVDSHGKKIYVVALKYDGEEEYRYLFFATDLAWRFTDIVQTYTLRWLVEVFFEDWKQNEGWGELKLLGLDPSSAHNWGSDMYLNNMAIMARCLVLQRFFAKLDI